MKSQFNEGDKVMILKGGHCGEFGTVCSSEGEFTAVYLKDKAMTFHNNNLKHEDDCVFTEDDLGLCEVEAQNGMHKASLHFQSLVDKFSGSPDTLTTENEHDACQENDVENLTRILPEDAKERKTYPMYEGLLKYFPRALAQVSHRSYLGNIQHHADKPLHWDRNKSKDELDALIRHMIGGEWDCVAWRALAHLEKQLEKGWKPEDD